MQRKLLCSLGVLILALLLTAVSRAGAIGPAAMKIPAPEIQGIDEWINSKPLSAKDLKGKVVVVHFWTFG